MATAHRRRHWKIGINCGEEHLVPHVHVLFRDGFRLSVAIDSLEVLAGAVRPARRLAPALTWIAQHRQELLAEYRRLSP
ncbi:MAG: DUF4160 domain-containing protein [Thermodesulfobacteriota bacterium]